MTRAISKISFKRKFISKLSSSLYTRKENILATDVQMESTEILFCGKQRNE
jgi:hypothetical protein